MDRRFGRFFRHANTEWLKPFREAWIRQTILSLLAAVPSYFIMAAWLGVSETSIEVKAALSLAAGAAVVQVVRYLWLLLIAPFDILKEQDRIISSLEKITDRKSIIGQLQSLWTEGVALRNKGESLMHESRVEPWWNEHLEWRNRTKTTLALLDANKAQGWWTLGLYTPRRVIPQAFTPLHQKRIQMFDGWLDRLHELIQEFQAEDAQPSSRKG